MSNHKVKRIKRANENVSHTTWRNMEYQTNKYIWVSVGVCLSLCVRCCFHNILDKCFIFVPSSSSSSPVGRLWCASLSIYYCIFRRTSATRKDWKSENIQASDVCCLPLENLSYRNQFVYRCWVVFLMVHDWPCDILSPRKQCFAYKNMTNILFSIGMWARMWAKGMNETRGKPSVFA